MMTKDFTKIGRVSAANEPQATTNNEAARTQGVVLLVIQLTAVALLFAGIWLVSGNPSPIPQESSFIVGIAFIVSALIDFIAVKVLRRVWAKKQIG
jgi:hypothetical protein